ncbi:MAG TPA: acetyl-CoA carboxylase biotin carboxyl carrier protein [Gaiellaceae bacterium]|jgi:oxaloacetate decarboxylase alpha subunit|nr:acetyl-CoA carboxylase biotin carboxyl carrier protein [Gaiellaceae bacterium]
MPRLVDTTIRVLSQEPLAGLMPTADLLRLAEILDAAGFAYLEVSGGGVFDNAVRRGVESPWERIRALKGRTKTPLALALRGRFLVGSRPVGGDFARRFISSAAASGIDIFRLHDPLNDVGNLRDAGEAIVAAGGEFEAGLLYGSGRHEALVEAAKKLPDLGAGRILLNDPAALLQPHRASELVAELRDVSGLPVGLYAQGAGGNALASAIEAARAGADIIASAVYPVALTMHRVSGEAAAQALAGLGLSTGVDQDRLWEASELVDEHIGDEPVSPVAPRIAVRAAQRKLPVGLVGAVDAQLNSDGLGDRLDEVLDEVDRVRTEVGSPPLAAPIGNIVASQALLNVLSANRYSTIVDELRELVKGQFGRTPAQADAALVRAVELVGNGDPEPPVDLDELRDQAEGLASSEEELLLLALFGEEAEPLLRSIRERSGGEESLGARGVDQVRAERIREVVRIVQETGVGEITIEEGDMRVSVRRTAEPTYLPTAPVVPVAPAGDADLPPVAPRDDALVRVESPMVGTFYRSPAPGSAPFVEEGDAVAAGQTLCILEAMKLMNEVKAETEGIVRAIHVGNAEPVEFGQLLFELEPVNGRLLDAV